MLSRAILASGGPAVVRLNKFSQPLQFDAELDGNKIDVSVSFRLAEGGDHFELWYIHADSAHGAREWRIGRQQPVDDRNVHLIRLDDFMEVVRQHILHMHSPHCPLVVLEEARATFIRAM